MSVISLAIQLFLTGCDRILPDSWRYSNGE